MTAIQHQPTYARHRYPKEIISYAVWLYQRFGLSYRDVEDLLAERGVIVSYETIHKWCLKFWLCLCRRIRHRRCQIGDKWHLDEVFVTIRGKRYYLYRAIDQYGNILDILLLQQRNRAAILKFFKKLRATDQCVSRVIVTDKLRSYQAAPRSIFSGVDHRHTKGLTIGLKPHIVEYANDNASCNSSVLCSRSTLPIRFRIYSRFHQTETLPDYYISIPYSAS